MESLAVSLFRHYSINSSRKETQRFILGKNCRLDLSVHLRTNGTFSPSIHESSDQWARFSDQWQWAVRPIAMTLFRTNVERRTNNTLFRTNGYRNNDTISYQLVVGPMQGFWDQWIMHNNIFYFCPYYTVQGMVIASGVLQWLWYGRIVVQFR